MQKNKHGNRRWIEHPGTYSLQAFEYDEWVHVATVYYKFDAWMVRWEHDSVHYEDFTLANSLQEAQEQVEEHWTQHLMGNIKQAIELLEMWNDFEQEE